MIDTTGTITVQQSRNPMLLDVLRYKDKIKVHDIEAAATITFTLVDSVVDQIVFSKNKIDRDRLLTAAVDAVGAYLLGNREEQPKG